MSIQRLGAPSNAIHLEYRPSFSDPYSERLVFEDDNAVIPERPAWGFTFNQDYIRHPEQ